MVEKKIKIIKDGPYIVSGNVDLSEKTIMPDGENYVWEDSGEITHNETYTLCRCGASHCHPFCDGSHSKTNFDGTETASRDLYKDRAELLKGKSIDMLDDDRCANARFCHTEKGSTWQMVACDDDSTEIVNAVIKSASECPTGRLTAVTKAGVLIDPLLDPAIEITQDSEKGVSSGIYVKGGIPLVAADGFEYEKRNRIVLCRCGKSKDKPFCDGAHIEAKFKDKDKL